MFQSNEVISVRGISSIEIVDKHVTTWTKVRIAQLTYGREERVTSIYAHNLPQHSHLDEILAELIASRSSNIYGPLQ